MRFKAELLATSIDSRSTAQYAVTFGAATCFIDVHPDGTSSGHNLVPKTARIIARELTGRYVAAQGNWPKTHSFEVK